MMLIGSVSYAAYGGGSKSSVGGGGGGGFLVRDNCPGADTSGSFYDKSCGDSTDEDDEEEFNAAPEEEVPLLDIFEYAVSGQIFDDKNKNGRRDVDENGIEGAEVSLWTYDGELVDEDTTGISGFYLLVSKSKGLFKVKVTLPDTKVSFLSRLVAFIAPPVYAAESYEFLINIDDMEEGETILANIPVADGKISSSIKTELVKEKDLSELVIDMQDSTDDSEEANDDDSHFGADVTTTYGAGPAQGATLEELLDEIRDRNDTNAISSLAGQSVTNGANQYVLPAVLPRTGASL